MLRDQFPIFEKKIFINSCSKGALADSVARAYEQYLHDWATEGSPWEHWVGQLETLRSQFAAFVNASPDEIAVKTSVSDAVNAIASALDFSGGRNRIVVSDFEFPTTAQIWHAQAERGAEIVHVPEADNTTIPLEHYAQAIDDRTALVQIAQVCYRNGAKQDVEAIIELAHENGALVLLDAYQALGTLRHDLHALKADFVVGGALKYMLASAGLAFLYVRANLIESLYPTATGWFAQDDIFAMDIYGNDPSPTARRFESGTPPNPVIYAGIAGLELLQKVGIDSVAAHIDTLTAAIRAEAEAAGYQVVTPAQHGALMAIRSTDVTQLVGRLAEDDIIVSSRDGNLRISPHFYNTLADIEALFAAMRRYEHLLAVA